MSRVVPFWSGSELSHVEPSAPSTGRERGRESSFVFLESTEMNIVECELEDKAAAD